MLDTADIVREVFRIVTAVAGQLSYDVAQAFTRGEMTRSPVVTFVVGTVFGSVIAAASLNVLQSQIDPMKQSPQYYTIRIANDRVRVLEYRLPSGQREPMHSHPPGLVFITSDGQLRTVLPNGSVSEASLKAGEVHWRDATTHAAENIGTTEFTALAVELKPCGNTK